METIIGTVFNVLFSSDQNDFKVFILRKKDNSKIRVTGEFPQIIIGAKLEVHGSFKTHPKYGLAFKAEAHSFSYEKTPESMALYIQSIAKWLGPVKSQAITKKFGSETQNIIENNPEKLTEIEGIGEKIAQSLSDAWKLNRNMKDIQIFLHDLGLSVAKIKRIITMFGSETESIIRNNPWVLSHHGFGFSTCDIMASKLDKDLKDGQRYKEFILYILDQVHNTGHLFLYPTQLLDAFNNYNKKAEYPFKNGDLKLEDIAEYVKDLVKEANIINDQNRIYTLSSFFYENESAKQLVNIFSTKSGCKLNPEEADAFIERYEKQNSLSHTFKLSDNQIDAIKSFYSEKILIVTGGPGTGKTTLTKALVQIMKEKGITFELLTPTGIAAKRLGNTANNEAYTIHRRLGYKGTHWDYNNSNKYEMDAVIIDEMSMVDQEVFYRLVSALRARTKIVFVGDNDQLPSVGPGCVLRELIESKKFKTIFLNKIFRQGDCSEIILESKKIRDGDPDLTFFRPEGKADIWHISEKDETKIENTIIKFASQLKEKAKDKKDITFQIITPRNDGPLSVNSLNKALQDHLNPPNAEFKELKLDNCTIRRGDRIIIKKNNYTLDVYNGDVGKVALVTPYSVLIDIDDFFGKSRRVEIDFKQAEEMLKLAYSLTVHKCQGMEYSIVLIPLIKAHGNLLLQRNLLYTAVTRAKKKVIIIGNTSAIEQSIKNDKIQKRNTLFSERINQWISNTGISLQGMYSNLHKQVQDNLQERLLKMEDGGVI